MTEINCCLDSNIHLCITNFKQPSCWNVFKRFCASGREAGRVAIAYRRLDIYKWFIIIVIQDLSDRFFNI